MTQHPQRKKFLQIESASGLLLMLATVLALTWSNSSWSEGYHAFWNTSFALGLQNVVVERSLRWVVNDLLMVIFFFVAGLEIRREITHGELSDWRRAALPMAAALGGMVVPALLYIVAVGSDRSAQPGWGIPMATDIAFAVGVLSLLRGVPPALRILLLAVAIIDDIGAILVIALFYSSPPSGLGLFVAALGVGSILGMQRLGIRAKSAYLVPGGILWAGLYTAGLHPTLAGVILGLATPTQSYRGSVSPCDDLLTMLHPWVAFCIMPVFALANAGVTITLDSLTSSSLIVALAIVLGLALGKPLGILGATWLAVRLGIAALPRGLSYRHVAILGVAGGIGFTMSLFIAQLAFTQAALLDGAKVGVLVASSLTSIVALALGSIVLPKRLSQPAGASWYSRNG